MALVWTRALAAELFRGVHARMRGRDGARLVLVEHLLKVLAQVGGHAQVGGQQAALQRRGVDGPAQAPRIRE